MLKKLVLSIFLLYSLTTGFTGGLVHAEEINGIVQEAMPNSVQTPNDLQSQVESQASPNNNEQIGIDNQSEEALSEDNQGNAAEESRDNTDENAQKETNSEKATNQDQSTDASVEQNQNVQSEAEVTQDQFADGGICQEQYVSVQASCQDDSQDNQNGQASQSQETSIETGQLQNVTAPGPTSTEQSQGTEINAGQTQEVTLSDDETLSHSQSSDVSTGQSQSAGFDGDGFIFQHQLTEVNQKLDQEVKEDGAAKDKQQANIDAIQTQHMSSSGSAAAEQTQQAEVKGSIVDALKRAVDVGVNVTSRNYVEIVKDSVKSIVKIFQEIKVNDEVVDVFSNEYTLEELENGSHHQKFEKQYDWGNLIVTNFAKVSFNETLQQFETTMSSFLGLGFLMEKETEGKPTNDGPVTPPVDGNDDPVTPPQDGNQGDDPVTPPANGNEDPVTPPQDGNSGEGPATPPSNGNEGTVTPPQSETPVPTASQQPQPVLNIEHVSNPTPAANTNSQTASANTVKANTLPVTASNIYNYLLIGSLIAAGGLMLRFRRTKSN
ncbi:hypothetical protein [Neobacillus sp. Marseille-QA0830]